MNTSISSAETPQQTPNKNQNSISRLTSNVAHQIRLTLFKMTHKKKIQDNLLYPEDVRNENIQKCIQHIYESKEYDAKIGRPEINYTKYTVSPAIQVVFESVGITDTNLMIDIIVFGGLLSFPFYTNYMYLDFPQFIHEKNELYTQILNDREMFSETHPGMYRIACGKLDPRDVWDKENEIWIPYEDALLQKSILGESIVQ